MIHFLNQHDPGSALVRNSSHINSMFRGFAVTQVYEAKKNEVSSVHFQPCYKSRQKAETETDNKCQFDFGR